MLIRNTAASPTMMKNAPTKAALLVSGLLLLLLCSTIPSSVESLAAPSAPKKVNVIAGATGYMGRAVVRESVRQGYHTVALVRDVAKVTEDKDFETYYRGAQVLQCDVTNPQQLNQTLLEIASSSTSSSSTATPIEAVISCLASRTGIKKDAYAIDYQATLNCLQAAQQSNAQARHFVLLSAFCLRNPQLQFQKAKLKFEEALQSQSALTYSIVRPTAFFKSVSSQIEVVAYDEAPYVMFGDGEVTKCNPISECDLARYMIDCITDKTRENTILNVGGPDDPITMKMQGEMIFNAVGRPPEYVTAPLWLFDIIINTLQFFADVFQSESLADAAETGRIGKYYAVEDMLTTDPNEKYGTITLEEHYKRLVAEGRPEYDPYTSDALITRKQVANLMKVFT